MGLREICWFGSVRDSLQVHVNTVMKFNVCGSVHLGNKCFYSSPTECTISYVLEKLFSWRWMLWRPKHVELINFSRT
jgi:hypothetical protein